MVLNLAPFGRRTLRDKAAQVRWIVTPSGVDSQELLYFVPGNTKGMP